MNNRARSYLNYSQQLAELEGRSKVSQLERDIPKYIREENRWAELLLGPEITKDKTLSERNSMINDRLKGLEYGRETTEEYFSMIPSSSSQIDLTNSYEPASYEIIKRKEDARTFEPLIETQRGFIRRTERLLEAHKQRASFNDGLKGLDDQQIIQKVREVPTKLKKNVKSLLKKLEKFNVKLNEDGSVDYSGIPYEQVVKGFKKIENVVKIALMEKDLEFEYPQQLEKIKIKADILKVISAEEEKINRISRNKEMERGGETENNYEQYADGDNESEVRDIKEYTKDGGKGVKDLAQDTLIFESDITDKTFKDFENEYDREKRLRELWIDLKRKNALGGPDARTTREQFDLQQEIIDKIRDVRWKIDQELVKNNMEPLFKNNYHRYTRDEFMFDAEIQFSKLKNFLEKNPRVLKEDPHVGQEYMVIINLIRRKKLLEFTAPAFRRELQEPSKPFVKKSRTYYSGELDVDPETESKDIRLGVDNVSKRQTRYTGKEENSESKTKDTLVKQFEALAAKGKKGK